MKIEILYDNTSCGGFKSGWGFSCLVDGRILFDTGEAPEPLFENINRLNIRLEQIEAAVISHNHWDHTGGLWELLKKRQGLKVYACPGFGADFKSRVAALGGILIESDSCRSIDDRISVTGEVPGSYKGAAMPEQALIAKTGNGMAVITGCSHPGIVAMIEKARACFPGTPITLALGGFHLKDEDAGTIDSVVSSLEKMGVFKVGPTHCTGEEAKTLFRNRFGGRYVPICAGTQLEL
ncbi:MBL fold metallo-hydrolase [bacterium]|nr:MBL fold metallo-hydrolase [bacterium]